MSRAGWDRQICLCSGPLAGHQLEVGAAEGARLAGGEVGEGHPVGTAFPGVQMVHLRRESEGWDPLAHGIGVEKRAIDLLGLRFQDAVEANGI